MRSLTFPAENARRAKRTPSPQEAWVAAQTVMTNWLAEYGEQLTWPTVEEMQAAARAAPFGRDLPGPTGDEATTFSAERVA